MNGEKYNKQASEKTSQISLASHSLTKSGAELGMSNRGSQEKSTQNSKVLLTRDVYRLPQDGRASKTKFTPNCN